MRRNPYIWSKLPKMKTIIYSICFLLMVISCTKKTTNIIPGTLSNGKISGTVILAEDANVYSTNRNQGVTVSIPELNLTTQTDSSGLYSFSNIPQGTYSINFQIQGFGDFKIFNLNCYGGGEINPVLVYLYKNPTYTFNNLSANASIDPGIYDTVYNLKIDFNLNGWFNLSPTGIVALGLTPDFSINDKSCLSAIEIESSSNTNNSVYLTFTDFVTVLRFLGVKIKGT